MAREFPESGKTVQKPDFVPADVEQAVNEWLDDYEKDLTALLDRQRKGAQHGDAKPVAAGRKPAAGRGPSQGGA